MSRVKERPSVQIDPIASFLSFRPLREDVERYWRSVPTEALAEIVVEWFGAAWTPDGPDMRMAIVNELERRRHEKRPSITSFWATVCR